VSPFADVVASCGDCGLAASESWYQELEPSKDKANAIRVRIAVVALRREELGFLRIDIPR